MHITAVEWIGYVAAVCTTTSFVPQLVRVVRLRSARDISLGMFLIFSFGTLMWMTYGWLAHSMPVVVSNAVTAVLAISIMLLKLRYDRNAVKELKEDL